MWWGKGADDDRGAGNIAVFCADAGVCQPGGGVDKAEKQWKKKKSKYLFNEFALAKVFRARFLEALTKAGLSLPLAVPRKWVVDCTCAGKGLPALKYLSRYLYRGVIGESNIVSNQDGNITFKYVESRTGKTLHRTIKGQDFIWLVLQHVLPQGFRRVRDYGFLHGRAKKLLSLVQLVLQVLIQAGAPRPRPVAGEAADAIPNERLPYLRQIVVSTQRSFLGCMSFDDLKNLGAGISEATLDQAARKVTSEDIAMIQFTSGTTAMPKGAMLYHVAMLRGAYYGSQVLKLTEADRFFSPQPFFHVGGSIKVMLAPIVSGCTMIVQPYFDAGAALELMERHRCNVLMGHQPHFIEYLNHPDLKKRKLVLEKGMIFASPEINKRVYDEMGIKKLISPYGLTETHIGGTVCEMDDPLELRMTTVGRPMPGVEMGIRQPEGKDFLPGRRTRRSLLQGLVRHQRLLR